MDRIACKEAIVRCTPNGAWSWALGFDGAVHIGSGNKNFVATQKGVIVPQDVVESVQKSLAGKQYVTPSFSVPGTVGQVVVRVDEDSECMMIRLSGVRVVTEKTSGSFTITVSVPATMPPPTNSTDTVISKSGRWEVVNAGQEVVRAGPQIK